MERPYSTDSNWRTVVWVNKVYHSDVSAEDRKQKLPKASRKTGQLPVSECNVADWLIPGKLLPTGLQETKRWSSAVSEPGKLGQVVEYSPSMHGALGLIPSTV